VREESCSLGGAGRGESVVGGGGDDDMVSKTEQINFQLLPM